MGHYDSCYEYDDEQRRKAEEPARQKREARIKELNMKLRVIGLTVDDLADIIKTK